MPRGRQVVELAICRLDAGANRAAPGSFLALNSGGAVGRKSKIKKLATKEGLRHEIAELAGMTQKRFNDLEGKLDVRTEGRMYLCLHG